MGDNKFAIVEFDDGSLEIIRDEWAIYDDSKIIASYFPSNISKKELYSLLQKEGDIDLRKFSDQDGNPFPVVKLFSYSNSYEAAMKKCELYLQLTDIESDEHKNFEKLKKSRHVRCIKKKYEEFDDSIEPECSVPKKRKQIAIISNTLWKPAPSATLQLNNNDSPIVPEENETCNVAVTLNKTSSSTNSNSSPVSHNTSRTDSSESFHMEGPKIDQQTIKKINAMYVMMKSIAEKSESSPVIQNFFDDEELRIFPVKNKEQLTDAEEKMKSRRFRDKVINALCSIGRSHSLKITIKNMLDELLTYELGKNYTFLGRLRKKPAFKPLKINLVVFKAVRKIIPNVGREEVYVGIKSWLHQCCNRHNRLLKKKETEVTLEEEIESIHSEEE
ncbi:uncharacterized protein LOC127289077 [Leptopilina boulardi]|uniref:uncharacterized protein LOC127287827 n=1 Tax=Leptopilina boulardi TaxID=63433 RepID=UPI0021F4FE12|nr:uncharacterized protein LOC127287827 [Leptopilina boulardi]XP_051172796.1 uncharacterized protein LOC127289077 [Leptopilina boulardi]